MKNAGDRASASEYFPCFRKDPKLVDEFIPERWDYIEICSAHEEQGDIDQQLQRLETGRRSSIRW